MRSAPLLPLHAFILLVGNAAWRRDRTHKNMEVVTVFRILGLLVLAVSVSGRRYPRNDPFIARCNMLLGELLILFQHKKMFTA